MSERLEPGHGVCLEVRPGGLDLSGPVEITEQAFIDANARGGNNWIKIAEGDNWFAYLDEDGPAGSWGNILWLVRQ